MSYNEIGFFILAVVVLMGAAIWVRHGEQWFPVRLFMLGVALRILGSYLRYELLVGFYGGTGDAMRYYLAGIARATEILTTPMILISDQYWSLRGSRWGTGFIEQISGVVLATIGETIRGEFLVFAMLAFVGAYLLVRAYATINPGGRIAYAAAWIWLWPSIWYWPSSVGKEALVLLAFGLTTHGYVGYGTRHRWISLAGGVILAYLIRPHVAAVLIGAIVVAELVASIRGLLTPKRLVQIVALLAVGAYVGVGAQESVGLEQIDLEEMSEVASWYASRTGQGGSSIEAPSGPFAPVQAFINVWLRPFPWEAHNMTSAFAAFEIFVFVVLLWRQRSFLGRTLLRWHRNPLLRFALPLVVSYTLMIGLAFANLGIIARQRSPMLPFVFLLLASAPEPAFGRLGRWFVGAGGGREEADRHLPREEPAPVRS